ncbi:Holliday junction resolvase RecU, partial [Xanthomonas citri pv. citri]|nr:Holliday junction resolvase RecU [Xanthomonas citri pv. citri]
KTSFPLQNFHDHQIEHMKQVKAQDGICFVIISAFDQVYFLEADKLFYFWDRKEKNGRKSIRKDELEETAYPISLGYAPRIDYISIIEQLY